MAKLLSNIIACIFFSSICVCVPCFSILCVCVCSFVWVRMCPPVVDMHICLWGNHFLKFQKSRSLILSLSFLSMHSIECVLLPFTFQQMKLCKVSRPSRCSSGCFLHCLHRLWSILFHQSIS